MIKCLPQHLFVLHFRWSFESGLILFSFIVVVCELIRLVALGTVELLKDTAKGHTSRNRTRTRI